MCESEDKGWAFGLPAAVVVPEKDQRMSPVVSRCLAVHLLLLVSEATSLAAVVRVVVEEEVVVMTGVYPHPAQASLDEQLTHCPLLMPEYLTQKKAFFYSRCTMKSFKVFILPSHKNPPSLRCLATFLLQESGYSKQQF